MRKALLLLLALCMLVSCENRDARLILSQAEPLLSERPREVRLWLEACDNSLFNTPRLRAEYALIYAMSLDKSWCDTTDVGVIMPAVEYYNHHKPLERKARTWFYLGRIQQNGHDYAAATASLMKARELAFMAKVDYIRVW